MNRKVREIVDELVKTVSAWEAVDTIVLNEAAEADVNDPYFFLSLDVYSRGEVPQPEVRSGSFPGGGAFESSRTHPKDRFLIGGIPVRVEYKSIPAIEEILTHVEDVLQLFRDTGTYMFYRLMHGSVLYMKSGWIDEVKTRLSELPDSFWNLLAESSLHRMEHYLSDLSAAVIREDDFFSLTSSAGFIRSAVSLLFALNREFEPSDRLILDRIYTLKELPANFRGHFDSFIRQDDDLPLTKKRNIAELLAKGLISMYGA